VARLLVETLCDCPLLLIQLDFLGCLYEGRRNSRVDIKERYHAWVSPRRVVGGGSSRRLVRCVPRSAHVKGIAVDILVWIH
jgi:hypothetical protein